MGTALRQLVRFSGMANLAGAPVCAMLFSQFYDLLPIKFSGYSENKIVGHVTTLPVIAHLFQAHLANAFASTKHIMTQGMFAEIGLHHMPVDEFVRLFLRSGNLIHNNLFLT